MLKGRDVIGKSIVSYETGQKIDRVKDLIFDQDSGKLLGFLIEESSWLSSAQVLMLKDVQVIGPDALIVPSKTAVTKASESPEINRIVHHNNVLDGTRIMTTDGRNLGNMVDLYFDERTGDIEGYEVSGGIFSDAYSGRSFVPAVQTFKIGEDVAFVPPQTAQLMEEQVGGIKAAMQNASEKVQETAQDTGDKLQEFGKTASEKVKDTTQTAGEKLQEAGGKFSEQAENTVAGFTVEQAEGRRVQHPVQTNEGSIVAASGQIVTAQVIERAKIYHREQALLQAVGLSSSDAARDSTGSAATAAGERFKATAQNTGQQVRGASKSLWTKIKDATSEIQDRNTQSRIQGALGRPVTRVILDKQDGVILNTGELITHESISSAREAGVLEPLLSSVYDGKPKLSLEDLRAPESGKAAL
jgi:uncharacterized protein YrrD